jgi:hypothetical protein
MPNTIPVLAVLLLVPSLAAAAGGNYGLGGKPRCGANNRNSGKCANFGSAGGGGGAQPGIPAGGGPAAAAGPNPTDSGPVGGAKPMEGLVAPPEAKANLNDNSAALKGAAALAAGQAASTSVPPGADGKCPPNAEPVPDATGKVTCRAKKL